MTMGGGLVYDGDFGPWWPYVFVLVAGFLATEIWRWAGVFVGSRLSEDSAFVGWVRAVATALVAGVIAKLVLEPSGSLADVPVVLRLAAAAAGFVCWYVARRNLVAGIAAAEVVLLGGWHVWPSLAG